MNNSRTEFRFVKLFCLFADMVQNGVCKCSGPVAECRMYHHARFLVDNHQILVLINNSNRDIFRSEFRCWRAKQGDLYNITRFDAVIGFDGLFINQHTTLLYSCLYLVACGIFHLLGQVLVDTHRGLHPADLQGDFFRLMSSFIQLF